MLKRSVIISACFVVLFALALLVLQFFAPTLGDKFAELRGLSVPVANCVLYTFYLCSVPAAAALYCLWQLLYNIHKGKIFEKCNHWLLSVLSWCCMAVAVLTLAATYHYMPFFLVFIAMVFMFLILRVVRICMVAGTELKDENNLTI